MNQQQYARRTFLQGMGGLAAAATFGRIPDVAAAEALSFWAPGIAKVAAKDFSAMEAQAGIAIKHIAKSARADEAIQKLVVGDGQKLYDALTDNGGGMEDALAQNEAIVPLDPGRIPNWSNILPTYREGGDAAETLRYEGQLYGVPYISNADSMAYNYDELGFHPDSWGVMFDSQFKGRVALQNDFGPTPDQHGHLPAAERQDRHREPGRHDPGRGQGSVPVPDRLQEEGPVPHLLGRLHERRGSVRQPRGGDGLVLGADPARGGEEGCQRDVRGP